MSFIDSAFKILREIISLAWRLFLFSKEEVIFLFTTNPLEKGMKLRKITILTTLIFLAYLLGGITQTYGIQIILILPIALGLILTTYTYKDYKERLKYVSDCILYGLATITSAYLVTNTSDIELNFFEHQMKGSWGFLITNFFAVAASIRFSISCVEAWGIYRIKKE